MIISILGCLNLTLFGPSSRIPIMPEDSSGLVDSSKDRAHGRLHQGDSQTLSGTGSRPARWGLTADGTPRERGRQSGEFEFGLKSVTNDWGSLREIKPCES
ncbi:hypothetical protein ILYODFUR_033909 [Ilyodon furcidens]|uniref:Uncharacterized protein n=1 Tax=Ilyodon furcidens TaxID=33524 RepID=A0ABV0V9A0_9TELE